MKLKVIQLVISCFYFFSLQAFAAQFECVGSNHAKFTGTFSDSVVSFAIDGQSTKGLKVRAFSAMGRPSELSRTYVFQYGELEAEGVAVIVKESCQMENDSIATHRLMLSGPFKALTACCAQQM